MAFCKAFIRCLKGVTRSKTFLYDAGSTCSRHFLTGHLEVEVEVENQKLIKVKKVKEIITPY